MYVLRCFCRLMRCSRHDFQCHPVAVCSSLLCHELLSCLFGLSTNRTQNPQPTCSPLVAASVAFRPLRPRCFNGIALSSRSGLPLANISVVLSLTLFRISRVSREIQGLLKSTKSPLIQRAMERCERGGNGLPLPGCESVSPRCRDHPGVNLPTVTWR